VRMEESGVVVESSLPSEPLPVMADSDQIYEVFLNLATNALDAMPHGGKLRVRAEMTRSYLSGGSDSSGPFLAVSLEDTGIGIPREHLVRIFDPYFTTKGEGKGTGLGLSVSHGIIKRHGGWIDVDSQEGRGTCLTVYLPVREAASHSSENLEGQRS
jgi:two-component system cell cycle sensor histidine kinase/response regulator CckA